MEDKQQILSYKSSYYVIVMSSEGDKNDPNPKTDFPFRGQKTDSGPAASAVLYLNLKVPTGVSDRQQEDKQRFMLIKHRLC